MTRRFLYIALVLTGFIAGGIAQPFSHLPSYAQTGCQTFPETGKTVCGRFYEYWQQHGGLAQQGYPISGQFIEVSDLNGKPYTVQYFERAVFESHPENLAPNDILLSQLGTLQFKRKYSSGEIATTPAPTVANQPAPATTATATPVGPLTIRGRGEQRTAAYDLKSGNYTSEWTASPPDGQARCEVTIKLMPVNQDRGQERVVAQSANVVRGDDTGTVTFHVAEPGLYFLQGYTTCSDWIVTLTHK